ncbi:MAG: hypothetical protein FJW30_24085 [Acidobacteria bacterium]|nr:hypothetical protein [Acidobacteriota bacterium]
MEPDHSPNYEKKRHDGKDYSEVRQRAEAGLPDHATHRWPADQPADQARPIPAATVGNAAKPNVITRFMSLPTRLC